MFPIEPLSEVVDPILRANSSGAEMHRYFSWYVHAVARGTHIQEKEIICLLHSKQQSVYRSNICLTLF